MTQPSPADSLDQPQARTVKDFCRVYGIGKTTAFKLIGEGRLRIAKVGTRTLIVEESAKEWFASTQKAVPTSVPTKRARIEANRSEPKRLQTREKHHEI